VVNVAARVLCWSTVKAIAERTVTVDAF